MARSLLLFLSLWFFILDVTAQSNAAGKPVCDCSSKKVKDSLIERYIGLDDDKYWYTTAVFGLSCDTLISICPNIAYAYQHKALPYIKYGDWQTAFPLEDKAVELEPNNYTAYRGFLKCIFTKDYDGALIDFEKAQQLMPNGYEMDHTYFFYQGLCNLELGNYASALKNMQQDIKVQMNGDSTRVPHFNSLFYLGVVYYELKDYAMAKEYLLTCLRIYEQHPQANYWLAQVYKAQKNTVLAKEHLLATKKYMEHGYGINEGNTYYANYPHQVKLYEVEQELLISN